MSATARATTVLGSVLGDPAAWLFGTAGFVVRGGIVLLVAPIWTAPSPVGISILIGPSIIDTGRLTGPALAAAFIGVAGVSALLALAILASAWLEAAAFDRLVQDPEAAAFGASPGRSSRAGRRRALVIVQLVALLPVSLAAVVTAGPISAAVRQEILLPTNLALPLVVRAAQVAAAPLALLVASIVVAEALSGWLSRRVLLAPAGTSRGFSAMAAVRAAVGVVATSVLGWLLAAVLLLPALGAVIVAWDGLRRAWLAGVPIDPSSAVADLATGIATLVFVAVWVGALLLGGFASALRGALWTSRALPTGRDWTAGGD